MAETAKFPYLSIPREARWGVAVAGKTPQQIDPHYNMRLRISQTDVIASAGSCFAQRISETLQETGYNYLLAEAGPPFLATEDKRRMGYGLYSARYGNIYTALQLWQLFQRAFGTFQPSEPVWRLPKNGGFVDPFRPSVQPDGFASEEECLLDRGAHLLAVRRMFETVDVFAFTLGLTEAWISKVDGAVLPACPGSSLGGTYDPLRHAFINFGVHDVVEQMDAFIHALRAVNPKVQLILTVSPVPLLATFEPRHVLQATVYSKSVLRVAAEELVSRHDNVHYFASYEIVTATGDSKSYFEADHREVSSMAVAHVIDCFHRQFTGSLAAKIEKPSEAVAVYRKPMCDEDEVLGALAAQAG